MGPRLAPAKKSPYGGDAERWLGEAEMGEVEAHVRPPAGQDWVHPRPPRPRLYKVVRLMPRRRAAWLTLPLLSCRAASM